MKKIDCYSNKNILIKGLFEIKPDIFTDARGYFFESYNEKKFQDLGLDMKFVQDNISFSKKNVIRGMHFQKKYPQGKLIQCVNGNIFDVVIDLRNESDTFGQWSYVILNSEEHNLLYIPPEFAHGFLVLSDSALISYKCSDFYHPEDESGLNWNDKILNINWNNTSKEDKEQFIISDKDLKYKDFSFNKKYFDLNGNWIGE